MPHRRRILATNTVFFCCCTTAGLLPDEALPGAKPAAGTGSVAHFTIMVHGPLSLPPVVNRFSLARASSFWASIFRRRVAEHRPPPTGFVLCPA